MNPTDTISITSLMFASILVFISLFFSYWQKLKLEKEIVIGVIRAVVQLTIVGYILEYIFGLKSPIFTTLLLLFMIVNAAYNAANRGEHIEHGFLISLVAIIIGASTTIAILVATNLIRYEAYQVIPVGGMIVGNAMVALGLCYRQMTANFRTKREQVETRLSLGADIKLSSLEIIRDSIKTGMQPTIDSAKTLGIVSLPGMMTGLILAGTPPMEAIKYQIMVTFMLMSTTAIASFIASFLAYRGFFNDRKQLVIDSE